jgi:tRNA G46 methylase TrmB
MQNMTFSQACENNKKPILEQIKVVFTVPITVWEIGSGTGQHGCFFAQQLPHIIWQPTDLPVNLSAISERVKDSALKNINPPLALDVRTSLWPEKCIEGLFTANTFHIMHWARVVNCFE